MVENHLSCNGVLDQVEELAFLDQCASRRLPVRQGKTQRVPPKSDNTVDLSDCILRWKYLNLNVGFKEIFKASCC